MARRKSKPARSTGGAKIASQVYVGRTEGRDGFEACLKIGRLQRHNASERGWVCEKGSNPRKALARALRVQASFLSRRRGAFKGR
jgi:hypothetical protein